MANPALNAIETSTVQDAPQELSTEPLQYPDVIVRLGGFLAVVVVGAVIGWNIPVADLNTIALLAGLILLTVFAVVATKQFLKGNTGVGIPLAFAYAFFEGGFLGWISKSFDAALGDGIIQQTVLATTITFAAVVGISTTEWGKKTGRATRFFTAAIIGYLLFSIANVIAAYMGVGDGWGFGGNGILGIGISIVGVGIASWSVNVDVVSIIDRIGMPVHKGIPWALAFGLTVSILWLYLEFLRLFGRSR